jgi:hypothetical protein
MNGQDCLRLKTIITIAIHKDLGMVMIPKQGVPKVA